MPFVWADFFELDGENHAVYKADDGLRLAQATCIATDAAGERVNLTNFSLQYFTIEAVVYLLGRPPQGYSRIVVKYNGGAGLTTVFDAGPDLRLAVNHSTTLLGIYRTNQPLQTGNRYHVAASLGSALAKFYQNGVKLSEVTTSSTTGAMVYSQVWSMCEDSPMGTTDETLRGFIKEVRIWSGQLSDGAIESHAFKMLHGDEPGLEGYWRCEEGSGSTVKDSSPKARHGTLSGASWGTYPVKDFGARLVILDLSTVGVASSSQITWLASEPAGTGVTIETNLSLDGGATWQGWQFCTNGGAIPGITADTYLGNAQLKVWEHLHTTDPAVEPVLHSITITIDSKSEDVFGEAHLQAGATLSSSALRIRTANAELVSQAKTRTSALKIATGQTTLSGEAILRAAALALRIPVGVYVIDKDNYFSKNQPARSETVANYIEVYTSPLQPTATPEEVYKSNEAVSLGPGESKTVTVFFNDKPVIDAVAGLTEAGPDVSITEATYYAWGAMITLYNAGTVAETCKIVVTGRPLKVTGRELVVAKDDQSILEHGKLKYTFKDNHLIQTRGVAEAIANKLLASYKDARRDIELEWRGDPALVLGDKITVPEYQRGDVEQ